MSESGELTDTNNHALQPQDEQNNDDQTDEWKIYENKEIGVSFRYPNIFTRVDTRITNGETGRIFTGVLEFTPNHWIFFGGVTKDYSASKGGSIISTHGYEKQGEKYAINFVWGKEEIVPNEFWPINDGKDQALVVRNTRIEQILSPESIAVFLNIPESSFPGIVFEIASSRAGEPVDDKEVEILRQIVSSITFRQ